jgi:hypothetical protein
MGYLRRGKWIRDERYCDLNEDVERFSGFRLQDLNWEWKVSRNKTKTVLVMFRVINS